MSRVTCVAAVVLHAAVATAQPWAPPRPVAPRPAAPPRVAPAQPERSPRGFSAWIQAGGTTRSLAGVALYAGQVQADVGGRTERWFLGGGPRVALGLTGSGLDALVVGVGLSAGGFLGPVTLGGGPELSWLRIRRATRPDTTMVFTSFGLRAFLAVDLARWDHHALTASLDASVATTADALVLAAALQLGFRL